MLLFSVMCILLISAEHPDYDLILLSNRDEYFSRETRALHWWPESMKRQESKVLAGQDAERHGTWLALSATGRISALTNFRESSASSFSKKSRGSLPISFVTSHLSVTGLLGECAPLEDYGGFSLLCGDLSDLSSGFQVLSNRSATKGIVSVMAAAAAAADPSRRRDEECVCELSNAEVSEQWPKTTLGRTLLRSAIHHDVSSKEKSGEPDLVERLFDVLSTDTLSEHTIDAMKGSIFIPQVQIPRSSGGDVYGTRQQTVVLVQRGRVTVIERTISSGNLMEKTQVIESFVLPKQAS